MGKIEYIGKNEKNKPQAVCPNCQDKLLANIRPFENDMSKIMKSNCPKCGGPIFTAMILLIHKEEAGVRDGIRRMVEAANPKGTTLLGGD